MAFLFLRYLVLVHILMLLWQHARFQSLSSSKSNITICSYMGQNIQLKMFKRRPRGRWVWQDPDRTRYFALLSRKLRIKNKLLSVLEDEDSFIEVGTIISKVN